MTPPVQQATLEGGLSSSVWPGVGQRRASRFRPGDVVSLADIWVLLAVLWVSRVITGTLHPAVCFFGISMFGLLLSPRATRERLSPSALDDAGMILRHVWLCYGVTTALALLFGYQQPRVLLGAAVAAGPALIGGRVASHAIERRLRKKGVRSRTLIVGGGDIARHLVKSLEDHGDYGLTVVGAVDDSPKYGQSELGTRILGSTSEVPGIVESHDIETVIVAFSAGQQSDLVDTIRGAMAAGATVWVVPRLFELGAGGDEGDHLRGLPMIRLQRPARSRPEWFMKRALDFTLSAIGIFLLAPVLAVFALAILIDSGRPVLLRQRRVGLDGRPFDMLKFRTMEVCEDEVLATEWRADEERMTRVGRFLRDTSLDELPQLLNVLRGEMSLVGPRPERPYFVDLFNETYPHYFSRHRLPAGVTGWAQIHGLRGGDTSMEERVTFDNYYIENWSLAQDLKILIRTMATVVKR
ncbi:MAG: sugar transferase [Actinomycetota bacterium]